MSVKPTSEIHTVTRADVRRHAGFGAQQPVDHPGLSTELGDQPSGAVRDVGQEHRQDGDSQPEPIRLETTRATSTRVPRR